MINILIEEKIKKIEIYVRDDLVMTHVKMEGETEIILHHAKEC